EFFMRNPDKVYSTEALMMRVWNADSESGTDALRTAIKRLRKALDGDTAESDSMIENIPRIGYRLKSR
ncbi:MAG TPA: helix-turn-helix domain-containing protein, partial [Candidatus Obscuribacter sp.]|nr:helix-turn-helix domain-containing protein [Candidatus Obscuribacter sp.]